MTALKVIHVGLRQLGIAQEDARDLYERQTGVRSLRDMSPKQQASVVGELQRLGFKKTRGKSKLTGKFAPKLQALWLSAWNLGIVRDKKDTALLAFVQRQTGIDHTQFLHYHSDASKAIEALKAWMKREAGVDFTRISGRGYIGLALVFGSAGELSNVQSEGWLGFASNLISSAKGYVGPVFSFVDDHRTVSVILLGLALVYVAHRIKKRRLSDAQNWRHVG